jgi:pimeloyl-ACP methyl ester carboxylesterase
MRYNPDQLAQMIEEKTSIIPTFDNRKVRDKTIHFLKVGSREELPLAVFVHGSPGALNAYEGYYSNPELLEKMDMISVDRSGFGYSDFGESESSLMVQAELIAAILKDFPLRKKVLVGHSMGGPVLAKLAIEFPGLVDGMVMIAPSISPELEPSNGWRKVLNFPLICWITPPALRVCNQEIIPLKAELELMMDGWKNIMIPLTVVQGEEDDLVPMENAFFAKSMMENNPSVKTTMLKGKDHFILWSEISLIGKEILEVIKMIGN